MEALFVITPADVAAVPILAVLTQPLKSRILARAADIQANADEWVIHDGDAAYFWILLD